MDERLGDLSGEAYDRHYFETGCGPIPYDRAQPHWLAFFSGIAERIVADIGPRTVLDAGCAKGFLVEALRDRGVEAYGIDISAYAIGEVRPDIRRFCRLASVTQPIGQRYDLIVCIEVLEHLSVQEGERALANICRSATDVLFSSTPDDLDEPTHVNVRPRSFWIDRFADQGFRLDTTFDAAFVAPHAMRFRAGGAEASPLDAILEERDRLRAELATFAAERAREAQAIAALQETLADKARVMTVLAAERAREAQAIAALREALVDKDRAMTALMAERDRLGVEVVSLRSREGEDRESIRDLRETVASLRIGADGAARLIEELRAYVSLVHSTIGWRVLERLRRYRDRLAPEKTWRGHVWARVRALVVSIPEGNDQTTGAEAAQPEDDEAPTESGPAAAVAEEGSATEEARYQAWVERHAVTPHGTAAMRQILDRLHHQPWVSVITIVDDAAHAWLGRMIASVQAQIYPRWDLCLVAHGSTSARVAAMVEEPAFTDSRIRVRRLARGETMAGLTDGPGAVTGDFIALVDHDAELSPDALLEVVKRLDTDPDLDLLYSDEDRLAVDGRRVEPFFKPDWSPDLLLSMNYIGHLTVLRRSVLEDLGASGEGVDRAHDYDLLLRVTERTTRIAHIPKILYHGRTTEAGSTDPTPDAHASARRALQEALRRRGREGWVESARRGRYTVRYRLRERPVISIIIPTRDRMELLRQCVESLDTVTDYGPYEIIVVDNDSVEPATQEYLRTVAARGRVVRCPGPFNFSRISNLGAAHARGSVYLFLNNDTRARRREWLTAMVEQAQRPEVGVVGARLLYPDERIQHAGVVLGVGGIAGHAFKHCPGEGPTHGDLAAAVRNVSAVTAACMMVPRRVFEEVGGFDERLAVAFNDVDLCCRVRSRGYLIVYTPLAELYHLESASRKALHPLADEQLMRQLWGDAIRAGDPYYNPNLTLLREDWGVAV